MTITYQEVEKEIRSGLNSPLMYAEVKNGVVQVIVQTYSKELWRVQFYHDLTGMIVQAELILENDSRTLEFIHGALVHLETATVEMVQDMAGFSRDIIIVRKQGDAYMQETCDVETLDEFLQFREFMRYDRNVVEMLDGNGSYTRLRNRLKEYGLEYGA